jgi:hypothetical protein
MDRRNDKPRKPGPVRWPVVVGSLVVVIVGIGLRALSSALRETETPPTKPLANFHDPAPPKIDPSRLPDPAVARAPQASPARRIVPLLRPVLLSLHAGRPRQGGGRHRIVARRVPLRDLPIASMKPSRRPADAREFGGTCLLDGPDGRRA